MSKTCEKKSQIAAANRKTCLLYEQPFLFPLCSCLGNLSAERRGAGIELCPLDGRTDGHTSDIAMQTARYSSPGRMYPLSGLIQKINPKQFSACNQHSSCLAAIFLYFFLLFVFGSILLSAFILLASVLVSCLIPAYFSHSFFFAFYLFYYILSTLLPSFILSSFVSFFLLSVSFSIFIAFFYFLFTSLDFP
jgi:hypothetical protein